MFLLKLEKHKIFDAYKCNALKLRKLLKHLSICLLTFKVFVTRGRSKLKLVRCCCEIILATNDINDPKMKKYKFKNRVVY